MTLIEALNNPEYRAMIDCIEDIRSSMDGRDDDEMLNDCLAEACYALKKATGIDLS